MEAGGGGESPGHGGGVVGEAEAAVGAEEDDAAVASETVVEIGDGFAGDDFRRGTGRDAIRSPLAEDELHDGFAPAGEGDGGGEIVSVAAAADQGGVADAAGGFVEGASGGGCGGEIALAVEGYGADGVVAPLRGVLVLALRAVLVLALRAVFVLEEICGSDCCFGALVVMEADSGEGGVIEAGGMTELCVGEALAFAIEYEFAVINEGHAVGLGELLCAGTDEVDVLAFLEDEAGGLDGVAETLDAGNAAGAHAASVHEEGVELDAAVGGKEAAAAGIEGGIVFKNGDGGFDGVEGGGSAGEDSVAGFKGGADAGQVSGCGVGGDGPGAAVDEKSGRVGERGGHLSMVEQKRGGCAPCVFGIVGPLLERCQRSGEGDGGSSYRKQGENGLRADCRQFHGYWLS